MSHRPAQQGRIRRGKHAVDDGIFGCGFARLVFELQKLRRQHRGHGEADHKRDHNGERGGIPETAHKSADNAAHHRYRNKDDG